MVFLKGSHCFVELEEPEAVQGIGSGPEIRWRYGMLSGREGRDLDRNLRKLEPSAVSMKWIRSPAIVLGKVPVTISSGFCKNERMVWVVRNEYLHTDVLDISIIDEASGMEWVLESVIDDLDLEKHEMLISD